MSWIRSILWEIFGLFVDDGSFALMIVAWLGLTAFLLPHLAWAPQWRGPIFFLGLATILLASSIRYSRKKNG